MQVKKEFERILDLEAGARVLPVGAHLYLQGDRCSTAFVILNGWVALSVLLDDGSCQIVDFALPGAVLGSRSTLNAGMYHAARCLTLTRVYAIPQQKLRTIIGANPSLAVLLYHQAAANEARAHDHLTNIGLRDSRERIAHLLLELYVRLHGRLPNVAGEIIGFALSQAHIGQALGLTYVHVCRKLQILREQKIIRLANHKLEIMDPASLIAAAGIRPAEPSQWEHSNPNGRSRVEREAISSLPAGWMPLPAVPTTRPTLLNSSGPDHPIASKAALRVAALGAAAAPGM